MSLLFIDSFKNYTYLPLKWQDVPFTTPFSIQDGIGRKGGRALRVYGSEIYGDEGHISKTFDDSSSAIFGFAFKKLVEDYAYLEIQLCDGNLIQNKLRLYDTNFLWRNGDQSEMYGLHDSMAPGEWNYVELKTTIDTVSGTVDININEVNCVSESSVVTSMSGTNNVNKIVFRLVHYGAINEDYMYIDDLYVANTSGTTNNDFFGNCEVSVIYPDEATSSAQFDPSPTYSGADNYTLVNELVHLVDDTATYSGLGLQYDGNDDGSRSSTYDYLKNTDTVASTGYTSWDCNLYFRFSDISIPKNAEIVNAYLDIKHGDKDNYNYESEVRIYCIRSPGPTPQITSLADFDSRVLTNKYSVYYGVVGTEESMHPDLSGQDFSVALNELVCLPDWQEHDNIITVIARRLGNSGSNYIVTFNNAHMYDNYDDPYHPDTPKLYVTWTLPHGDNEEYVVSSGIGTEDLYGFNTTSGTTLSGTTEIFSIQHNLLAKREFDIDNPNDMNLSVLSSVSGTTYSGVNFLPKDNNYGLTSSIEEMNPNTTLAWNLSELLDAEFGFITTVTG